jgi:hypothetical protein
VAASPTSCSPTALNRQQQQQQQQEAPVPKHSAPAVGHLL